MGQQESTNWGYLSVLIAYFHAIELWKKKSKKYKNMTLRIIKAKRLKISLTIINGY